MRRLPHADYFGGAYFRAACPVGCGRSGFGQTFDALSAATQAGGPGIAYAQGATAGLQAQGQALYSQANNYATLGQGVANGNLSSVVTASNLAANQVPPGQTQSVLKSVGTTVAEATLGYTMTTALLTQGLTVLGATAAEVASAVPVLGTAVAAMIVATAAVLKLWGASGAGSATLPPLGSALLSVPLPIPTTTSSQGLTPGVNEPPLADPTAEISASSATSSGSTSSCTTNAYAGGDKVGGALGSWRDFLDFGSQANPTTAYAAALANGAPLPDPPATNVVKGGFSSGCATWQSCADQQLACVAFGLGSIGGGEPLAEAAVALAVRWVPFGETQVAPYNDVSNGVLAGWNVMQGLQTNLTALAYAYAAWPQVLADQQALAYLTSLAWTWTNYPGNSGPLPAWISYKLGHLQNLVAQDGLIGVQQTAAAAAATQQTTAAVTGSLVAAVAAAPTLYALVTKQRVGAVWSRLLGR